MSVNKPRPSSMPMLAVSPRWVNRPSDPDKKDEYAEVAAIGTIVHEAMYNIAIVANDRSKWAEIVRDALRKDVTVEPLIMSSVVAVEDLFSLCLPVHYIPDGKLELSMFKGEVPDGLYPEVGVDPGVVAPGTADLVMVMGETAEMVDYKNVFVERDHDLQMESYVVGIFRACPKVKTVKVRIVTPRLGDIHEDIMYFREQCVDLEAKLSAITQRVEDPFYPCYPGEFCVTCAGNGRCPWQLASLKDVPMFGEVIPMNSSEWRSMMVPDPDLDIRARRRYCVKWLEKFCEAVKGWDKDWALATKDAPIPLPGFKTVYGKGRASLDEDRLAELNLALMSQFGVPPEKLLEYAKIDVAKFASFVAMLNGISETDAATRIKSTMAAFSKEGTPTASFRVDVKALKNLGPHIAALLT